MLVALAPGRPGELKSQHDVVDQNIVLLDDIGRMSTFQSTTMCECEGNKRQVLHSSAKNHEESIGASKRYKARGMST